MPLIIDEKTLTNQEDATSALAELSVPSVVFPPVSFNHPDSKQVVVFGEGEIAYIDTALTKNQITHLVNKKMADCIVIYFTNGTEHAAIHVTTAIPFLNLRSVLDKFKNKTGITVTLLGGVDKHPRSMHNLQMTIQALLKVTQELELTITIKNQLLTTRNTFTDTNVYALMYDKILDNANYLSRRYFKKELNKSSLENLTSEDFKKPYTGHVPLESIETFAYIVSVANQLYFSEISDALNFYDLIMKHKTTEGEFLAIVKILFSKTGFEKLNKFFKLDLLEKTGTKLYNFAIHLNTSEISEVSECLEMPFEILRDLRFLDPTCPRDYRVCFDADHYEPMAFAENFLKRCKPVAQNTDLNVVNRKQICDFYNALYPDRPLLINTELERSRTNRKIIKIHQLMCYLKLNPNLSNRSDTEKTIQHSVHAIENPIPINQQGIAALTAGKLSEALTLFEKAERLQQEKLKRATSKTLATEKTSHAAILYNLGTCLFKQGKNEEAKQPLTAALELRKSALGETHELTQKAEKRLQECIQAFTNSQRITNQK